VVSANDYSILPAIKSFQLHFGSIGNFQQNVSSGMCIKSHGDYKIKLITQN